MPFPRESELDVEMSFEWFNLHHSPTVYLCSRRMHVNLMELIKRPTKTKLWDAFMNELADNSYQSLAMFFMLDQVGMSVIHNVWSLSATPGEFRLLRRASSADRGIIIDSSQCFMDAMCGDGLIKW